jgi:predicted nuclease of predicted toxin-antitoxin system
MRLVADESCDFSVVVGVRGAGHDVIAIAESMSGVDDEKVIELAASERRLLLTEDKDFGQLVFAATKQNSGVVLIRYPASTRSTLATAVVELLAERGEGLYSRFVVLEPGRARVTQLVI